MYRRWMGGTFYQRGGDWPECRRKAGGGAKGQHKNTFPVNTVAWLVHGKTPRMAPMSCRCVCVSGGGRGLGRAPGRPQWRSLFFHSNSFQLRSHSRPRPRVLISPAWQFTVDLASSEVQPRRRQPVHPVMEWSVTQLLPLSQPCWGGAVEGLGRWVGGGSL